MNTDYRNPSSFSTICTKSNKEELFALLLSLSVHHKGTNVYCMCDNHVRDFIEKNLSYLNIKLFFYEDLNAYKNFSKIDLVKNKMFSTFLSHKMKIMNIALKDQLDTFFLDADIVLFNPIKVNFSKEVGLSKQYVDQNSIKRAGVYNAGAIWTKSSKVVNKWENLIDHNHEYNCNEQINMCLLREFDYYEFDESYNVQAWRYILGENISQHLSHSKNQIFYKSSPLTFIHTHFHGQIFKEFNELIIYHLKAAKKWKELIIIYRLINKCWNIKIPKQPMEGLAFHANDSFRELASTISNSVDDVNVTEHSVHQHCILDPNIILYDRPTLKWYDHHLGESSLVLLGNGSVKNEGERLKQMHPDLTVSPWIFWPRHAAILEKFISSNSKKSYNQRATLSIFIGNFENETQKKYRKTENWQNVIEYFSIQSGTKHLFSQNEYLELLSNSKFGLCLRGYGSKCHREIELLALGTVPIFDQFVETNSYIEPLIENVHYLKVESAKDIPEKLSLVNEAKWKFMSEEGHKWFFKFAHSSSSFQNTVQYILHDLEN